MTRFQITASCLAALLTASTVVAAGPPASGSEIPGQYIVVLKHGAVRAPGATVLNGPDVTELAGQMALRYNSNTGRKYRHALSGFVMKMDRATAAAVARDPRVQMVEPDRRVAVTGVQSGPPSWGLDRIDQRTGLDNQFAYATQGQDVHVFLIDTGIRSSHTDFEGRVDTSLSFSAVQDGLGTEDCFGHGTHVAGIIGGATYGVAKAVTLHPARVLGCDGTGAVSDIIAALDWVTSLKQKGKMAKYPFVVNMSIGGVFTWSLDLAVQRVIDAGAVFALAAGNSAEDPCDLPVYRLPQVLTVGASDQTDSRYASSNFGSCLNVYAPGVGITSAYIRSDTDAVQMSGTSMAAPHVAGAAALYLAANPKATPAEVQDFIISSATAGALPATTDGSPDLLLYVDPGSGSDGTPSDPPPPPDPGVDNPPNADFSFHCNSKRYVCSFDATASTDDLGIASYDWDFGDGTTGSGSKARHDYPSSPAHTTYPVTLFVTDTAGQTTSVTLDVTF